MSNNNVLVLASSEREKQPDIWCQTSCEHTIISYRWMSNLICNLSMDCICRKKGYTIKSEYEGRPDKE